MNLSRLARLSVVPAAVVALAVLADTASSQKKGKTAAGGGGEKVLAAGPRPTRPDLPPSTLPLDLIPGERVALVGNSTAERMNLFGHFETMLHLRFPDKKIVVRNFGRPADEVGIRQRSNDYTKIDDPLFAFGPDTFLCFFGFNESFAGPAGVDKFKADYEAFLDEYAKKYPRDDAGSKPRFVLVSPIAFEPTGNKFLPDGAKENANLKLYADAVKAVADKRGLAFVDVFTPTLAQFTAIPKTPLTINGAHLNESGDKALGTALNRALFGPTDRDATGTSEYEKLRAAVNDKSWVHLQDYRMVNGWYVYGGRRTFDHETFPREYAKIRNMAAIRDWYVWDIAAGKPVPAEPDDSGTGELFVPETRFGNPRQNYSENAEGGPVIRSPEDFIKTCEVHPGTELKLFADEKKFPEIAKPVQLNFDNKGRLWVSCMPSYPQWQPGHGTRANDKLVILEDTNGDGSADKSTVFYDKLHCPTGFEFFDGGVLVTDQPRLLFLKDTDGDDKADVVVHLLDGWATDDTHHSIGAFEWGPGGKLRMLEGIATSTTVETPWGPHRSAGTGGCYVFDPRTQQVRQFKLPGMANMWCYTFDDWGNGIVGDGTTANQTWEIPLSGEQYAGRKGVNFILPKGVRPNIGNEWLISRNLPDDLQGQFTYACVIQLNGLTRYDLKADGAGFMGTRLPDLLKSPDKHFRPADPQIGPDGALWFADWANPLIGHMQYSQRDPNRDHVSGRVYRLVGKDRPLVTPVTQFGKGVPEILEQFREYEWRTHYRTRRELRSRPAEEVLPAVAAWASQLNPADPMFDRLRCEALWVQQGFHAVDPKLLEAVMAAKTPDARAAATLVATEERDRLPNAFDLLVKASQDDNPRVRCVAARGLSFYDTAAAVDALIAMAKLPMDYWVRYTVEAALAAHDSVWRAGFLNGSLAKDNPEAAKLLRGIVASNKQDAEAVPFLSVLLSQEPQPAEAKNKAMTALADLKGDARRGRAVFERTCTACHKVAAGTGEEFGPNLDKVAERLKGPYKIVESIIEPNAEIDEKYLSTKIETLDGRTVLGLVVGEDAKSVVVFDGKEKKTVLKDDIDVMTKIKQSSMPEGLAGAMAPGEFVDLITYLGTLK